MHVEQLGGARAGVDLSRVGEDPTATFQSITENTPHTALRPVESTPHNHLLHTAVTALCAFPAADLPASNHGA